MRNLIAEILSLAFHSLKECASLKSRFSLKRALAVCFGATLFGIGTGVAQSPNQALNQNSDSMLGQVHNDVEFQSHSVPSNLNPTTALLTENDLAEQLLVRSIPINQTLRSLYSNPGDVRFQDSLSLSEAYAGILSDKADKAVYPQEGTGRKAVRIGAKSFLNLDSHQSVWGNAQFSTGSYRDIKWSNCIDYQRIAPYVLGDEVGGDLSFRQYVFGGGYSYLMDNGFIMGASLDYRAEIAWRDRDPRVRTIVSDLAFSLGASYRYNDNRFVGVSAAVESYTQNCDLDFYNPMNQINTLPLTGLGSYNKRFSGNTNKNSGHSGFGYKVGCHLGTVDHNGLEFDLRFKDMRMNQLLRNFNNITFAFTDTYVTHATMAYPFAVSRSVRIMPTVDGEYFHRLGTENIFGTSSGASYVKIGSRSPYLNQHIDATLSVPLEFSFGRQRNGRTTSSSALTRLSEESEPQSISNATKASNLSCTYLTIEPSVSYHSMSEELTSLGRKIEVATISPEMQLSLNHLRGQWLYAISGNYGWTNCLSDKWTFPGYDSASALQESVASNFLMLSSSGTTFGGELAVSRQIDKLMFGISVNYNHVHYKISNSSLLSTLASSNPSTSLSSSKFHKDNLDISLKINF